MCPFSTTITLYSNWLKIIPLSRASSNFTGKKLMTFMGICFNIYIVIAISTIIFMAIEPWELGSLCNTCILEIVLKYLHYRSKNI